jgi:hypothetical protein
MTLRIHCGREERDAYDSMLAAGPLADEYDAPRPVPGRAALRQYGTVGLGPPPPSESGDGLVQPARSAPTRAVSAPR